VVDVTNLPRTRQRTRALATHNAQATAQENLTRAFLTFTQAAGSLENSYTQLQAEVTRLHAELQRTNCELERSVEENARVRGYLSHVLESLPCGVLVVSAGEKIEIINPEARRLLQLDSQGAGGGSTQLPPPFAQSLREITSSKPFLEQEHSIAGGSGNRVIGISRANISEAEGSAGDTIWILRDVTEQKRIAGEREAARRSHALAEVAAVLAHEIRNPLGSLELFAGLLADATAHMPETRQWITHLQAGLRGLSATVNNVLQFHAQPAAQLLLTDLGRLLNETVDFLRPLARQRGQQVKLENAIGPVSAQADANRLKQVFLNLSLNAFRAMPPGAELRVRMAWAPQFPGELAQIDFRDQGRGVAPELLERIYEPGFTTTPGSPGLGLSVCKSVIEQHGGEIRVHSKPQQGSTFSLFLPVSGGSA
jgi:signal transduction histidine kinase